MQWREHITTQQLAFELGMTEGASVLLALRRLRWLEHVGRMTDDCLSKWIMFGELLTARPSIGQNLYGEMWRSVVYRHRF